MSLLSQLLQVALWLLVGLGMICLVAWGIFKGFFWIVRFDTLVAVSRWGDHNRIIGPGLNRKWPIADKQERVFSKQQREQPLEVQVITEGKLPLRMKVSLMIVETLDREVIERLAYEFKEPVDLLTMRAKAIIMQLLLSRKFQTVQWQVESNALQQEFMAAIADVAQDCGFRVIDLRIPELRQDPSIETALVRSKEAEVVRESKAADAEHKNALLAAEAEAAAAAEKIKADAANQRLVEQAEAIGGVFEQLAEVTDESAAKVVSALLHQQTIAAVAESGKAQIIVLPQGVTFNPVGDTLALAK